MATSDSGANRPPQYAYVFLLFGSKCEQYFLGTVIVTMSLMKHQCIHRRVLMHTRDVPRKLLDLAAALSIFTDILQTEYITANEKFFSNPHKHARFGQIVTKWRVLGLTQFDKVLFLDSDLFVRANIDHIFNLQPPVAMVRGASKPPRGELIAPHAYVNAGVMLLQPNPGLLERLLQEYIGENPKTLPNYDSPDADCLTEHSELRGKWRSLPLECNFQLEYEHLDTQQGTVQYNQARGAQFSEAMSLTPWSTVQVAHFSSKEKPWAHLLESTSALKDLKAVGEVHPALSEKLVFGIREYAEEVARLQGILSQLQLGEGTLWREVCVDQRVLQMDTEDARRQIHAVLPDGGRWYEHLRASLVQPVSAVWVPPNEGQEGPKPRWGHAKSPVGAYLEIYKVEEMIRRGSIVNFKAGDIKDAFEVKAIEGESATLQRKVVLPSDWKRYLNPDWKNAADLGLDLPTKFYYHNLRTGEVQWEHPNLPQGWKVHKDRSDTVYYYNKVTRESCWEPPDIEEIQCRTNKLQINPASTSPQCKVCIYSRSFLEDRTSLHTMQAALASAFDHRQ